MSQTPWLYLAITAPTALWGITVDIFPAGKETGELIPPAVTAIVQAGLQVPELIHRLPAQGWEDNKYLRPLSDQCSDPDHAYHLPFPSSPALLPLPQV